MKKIVLGLVLALLLSANAYADCVQGNCVNGQGTEIFPNGDKYVGEFKDNKLHGQGTYTYAHGDKYVGEWKDGKAHGQGTYTWSSGHTYVGEWKDNKRHGQGTEILANGDKYVGEWKDGKKQELKISQKKQTKNLQDYLIKNKLYLKKTHDYGMDKWWKLDLKNQKTIVFTFNLNKKGNLFHLEDKHEMEFVWNIVTKNSFNFKHPQSPLSPKEITLDFENNLAQDVFRRGSVTNKYEIITVSDADIKKVKDDYIKEEKLMAEYDLFLDQEYADKKGFEILRKLLPEMKKCSYEAFILEAKVNLLSGVSRNIDNMIIGAVIAINSNNISAMRTNHASLRKLAHQAFSSVAVSYGVNNPTARFCTSLDTNYEFKYTKFDVWKNKTQK